MVLIITTLLINHYSLSIQLSTSLLADKRSIFTIIEKSTIEFVTRVKDVQHILILSDILLFTLNLRSNLISVLKLKKKIIITFDSHQATVQASNGYNMILNT